MKKKRQEEIALLMIKQVIRNRAEHNGLRLGPKMRSEMKRAAKAMGIPPKQAIKFAKIQVKGLVNKTFR